MAEGSDVQQSQKAPQGRRDDSAAREDESLRKRLINLVSEHLTDLNAVHAQLSKDKEGTPQCETILEFLCSDALKDFFSELTSTDLLNSTHLLLLWLLMRLFRLLGSAKCRALHGLATACVGKLYHLCSQKAIRLFVLISKELAEMLTALAAILSDGAHFFTESSHGLCLSHFSYTAKQVVPSGGREEVLEVKLIELRCIPDCSYLVVGALSVLCDVAVKVNLFAREVTVDVVQSLGAILKHGSAVVKGSAIDALKCFLTSGWQMACNTVDCYVSGVVATAEFQVLHHTEDSKHVLAVMENSLADFLTWFFTSSSFVQPCHWMRLSPLLQLALSRKAMLTLSGQFQHCLSSLLNCYVLNHATQSSLLELGKAAIGLIGRSPDLQYVMPILVKLCQVEQSSLPHPMVENSSSNTGTVIGRIENLPAAKRAKMAPLSRGPKTTSHPASSLAVQTHSAMAPPTVGGTFSMKLGQKVVAMAKTLTNQLACQVSDSGVLTWKEGINWSEVMCLLEGICVVLETQCRLLTSSAHNQHWCTGERISALCAAWEWSAAAAAAATSTQTPVELDQILSKIYQCIGALYLTTLGGKVQLSSVVVDCCNALLTLCWKGMLDGPRSGIVGGTVLQREVRASVTELLKDSKAALTTAQCGSLLAASAFSSSVAPLQSITMTTEALAPGTSDAVQCTVIRCLPLWVTWEDASLHPHLTKWLQALLHKFNELSVQVCVELCSSAGSILAAVCPPGVVRVVHAHQWSTPFHQVSCTERRKSASVSVQGHLGMIASVSGWVVELCEQVGQHPSEEVKIAFLEGLEMVCQCMGTSDMLLLRVQLWKFLAASSPSVLKRLGCQLKFLLPKGTDGHVCSQLVQLLQQAYQQHLPTSGSGSYSARVAIVSCFGDLARCSTDNGLIFMVVMEMVKLFEDPSEPVRVTVLKQLHDVIRCHGYTSSILFDRLRRPLAEYLAERIHTDPEKILSKEKTNHLLQKILVLFAFSKVTHLFESSLQCLYPKLVHLCSQSPSPALDVLATFAETDSKTLLVMQFKYVFAHLICRCDHLQLTKALQFLESVLQVEVSTVLKSDPYSVINELAVCISLDPKRVRHGMLMVVQACEDGSAEGGVAETDQDKMIVDFIKPQLLGVFSMLNTRLLMASKQKNEELANQAVCSLTQIVQLMGADQVTPVRVKVMGMVRLAVQFPSQKVVENGCNAWKSLIRSIHLECLGPMLSQVIVTLSPLLDKCPHQVADIFHFLVVENRSSLSEYFGEVYSMPEHPLLSEVNSVFKEHAVQQQDFWGQLGHILKGLTHEQTAVRLDALEHLVHLLQRHRSTLSDSIVGSDRVEPVLAELITTLMRCSRDADPDVRVKIAECLGELGAVDPGRLDLSAVAKDTKPIRMYEIDGPSGDFAVNLLQELARAFLAAEDTRGQDCCAFAIQEVLLSFQCASADENNLGCIIWSSLPPESQAILRPYLHSQYTTQGSTLPVRKIPIYRPSRTLTFTDWIKYWMNHSIGKVLNQRARRIFDVCAVTFKYDHQLALFLLPHIICCVLRQGGDTDVMEVSVEIMAVINHACQLKLLTRESADCLSHCTQTVFSLLDHLKHWVQSKLRAAATQRALHGRSSASRPSHDPDIEHVQKFLGSLPKDKLAQAAFNSKAYARALMYMEDHLRQHSKDLQSTLGFLQQIYNALDEPDGVAGLSVLRKEDASVKEKILEHESSGQFSDAASYFNVAIKREPNDLAHYEGLLHCNMKMGHLSSVLMHVSGLKEKHPEWTKSLNAVRVEAAWRLGKWDELENYLANERTTGNWSIGLGRVLLAAKQKNEVLFRTQLRQVRSEQMGPLSASSMEVGSYKRSYEFIVRLHMLKELEEGVQMLQGMGGEGQKQTKEELLSHWRRRLEATQTSYLTREPILSLRRLLYGLATDDMHNELGQSWLESTAMARHSWLLETAGNYLRMAEMHPVSGLHLEQAKILHCKGDTHQALMDVQRAVKEHFPLDVQESATQKDADVHAKALLYIGRWMEETAHYETQTILKQYKSVIAVHPQSESGHFYLATYYERLMNVFAADKNSKSAETQFLPFVIRHYGDTLRHGNKFIYQSIPRLLTLWLDFGASLPDAGGSRSRPGDRAVLTKTLEQLNTIMAELLDQLPPYQFLIAFSQLISRICHPNSEVFMLIQAIILKLIKHYPQQSLWMMMAVIKSTHIDRQSRCQRILSKARSSNSSMEKQIIDMMNLTDRLLEVSNKSVDRRGAVIVSMDKLCRSLSRLTSDKEFSSIIVPNQSSLTVTLPMDGGGPCGNLNPFPGNLPTIVRFEDKVEVLSSLVRPKKVTILASDGQKYITLCKPEDDLRKDSRLMELFTVINKCLRKDPESRRRGLHIRTYSVVPLNEKCGLVEWVPNTTGLRNILNRLYQEKGTFLTGQEIKDLWKARMSDPKMKKENFEKHVLTRFPPVFSEWFRKTFPDPTQWYSSQVAYSRTAAVMSIVGYILGLGDRHGENILFDSTNGDCVHVDFNCLFNRGQTFDVPECVPFRLTHNMVDAMGVAGYEGVFRKSCEVTMRVLREQCDPLICILKTFVHDPLVEWKKQKGAPESIQAIAVTIIKEIEDRISGKGGKSKVPPLSITGQVHQLIMEASDSGNLSRMYIGWAAYL